MPRLAAQPAQHGFAGRDAEAGATGEAGGRAKPASGDGHGNGGRLSGGNGNGGSSATEQPRDVVAHDLRLNPTTDANGGGQSPTPSASALGAALGAMQSDAPACDNCGEITVRSGTCYKCLNCGASLGCS